MKTGSILLTLLIAAATPLLAEPASVKPPAVQKTAAKKAVPGKPASSLKSVVKSVFKSRKAAPVESPAKISKATPAPAQPVTKTTAARKTAPVKVTAAAPSKKTATKRTAAKSTSRSKPVPVIIKNYGEHVDISFPEPRSPKVVASREQ